ncbi:carbohydrate-binding domain-containing protein [Azospirillum sp.]|uniref:carbohydrate-binding domain-containing protein n=1 Tax=Azospirillum sp. TaxID=34012 RepID=UPI003D729B7D
MADFYVSTTGSDSNTGTKDSPFRTILKASQAASSGSTVHVASGTYQGGFQTTKSDITYVSDVKWGAKIVPGSSNGRIEAWDNRGSNVTIDGFEIDGSGQSAGTRWLFGVYTTGSNSVVQNMKVHDIVRDSTAWSAANTGQGGAGIMGDGYYGGSNIKMLNNTVYNIGMANQSSSLIHGVYMATSGEVKGNLIYQIVGDGVTTWHDATNLKIVNNTIFEANGAGIMIGAGDHYKSSGPNDYTQVSNNILYANSKGLETYGEVGTHNTYSNNLVYGNGTNWILKNGTATGTISADPKFVNYVATGGGDYHLAAGSPAINAGTSTSAPTYDLSGLAREGAVDIGAYEYRTTTTTTPTSPTPTTPTTPTSPTPTTPTAGTSTIVINANGTTYAGVNAHFKVLVDGVKIGEAMATTTAKDYAFTTTAALGAGHKVQVQYDNDVGSRDLYVNKFTVNGQSFGPTSSMVTYDKGALDGRDVVAGQQGMWWNGTLVASLPASYFPTGSASSSSTTTTAGSTITVNAQGNAAGGVDAHFNLLIDGKKVGEGTAGSTAKDFTFNSSVTADQAHKVQVQFDNDALINGQDRNLIVNKITINGKAVAPTASIVTYDKYALDGQDVIAGQSGMWWDGTLVVNADKSYFPAATAAAAQLDVYDHLVAQSAPTLAAATTATASAASFELATVDATHTLVMDQPHVDAVYIH